MKFCELTKTGILWLPQISLSGCKGVLALPLYKNEQNRKRRKKKQQQLIFLKLTTVYGQSNWIAREIMEFPCRYDIILSIREESGQDNKGDYSNCERRPKMTLGWEPEVGKLVYNICVKAIWRLELGKYTLYILTWQAFLVNKCFIYLIGLLMFRIFGI